MILSVYLFDRKSTLIFHSSAPNQSGLSLDNTKLLHGMVHTLHVLVNQLSPSGLLPLNNVNTIETAHYRLHILTTLSSHKLVVASTLQITNVDLWPIYSSLMQCMDDGDYDGTYISNVKLEQLLGWSATGPGETSLALGSTNLTTTF
ncbi:hypothetical protein DAMA08_028230 [Martiniozyma asiatica (nom. inval.)]|nr:hypothetical protein DAMA08_028230 [Martiniozyma asiatica]